MRSTCPPAEPPTPRRSYPAESFDAPRVAPPLVAVCVPTFRRPVMLRLLLESLGRLELPPGGTPPILVVIDNDREECARAVVDSADPPFGGSIVYLVEPERNIALARNRGVVEALALGSDFVAFIDDDELAHPGWLAGLLREQERSRAEVVCGPVLPRLPADAPTWVRRGGFFERGRYPPGGAVKYASTSNVLIAARLLRGTTAPFDPAFGRSGGSDTAFFIDWQRRGASIVWAVDAVVEEHIPATRVRGRWVLQRAFRNGNSAVRLERRMPPQRRRLGSRLLKGTLRMLYGGATLVPLALLRGRAGLIRALWNVAYGAGCLAALTGYKYIEYRTVHGG